MMILSSFLQFSVIHPRAMQYWGTLPHETLEDTGRLHTALMEPSPGRYFMIEFQGLVAGIAELISSSSCDPTYGDVVSRASP